MAKSRLKKKDNLVENNDLQDNSTLTKVTILGDSTIDNRIWLDGIIWNWIKDRFNIKRDSVETRIKKALNPVLNKPILSVVEHMICMLPDHDICDLTNDGFTTDDVVHGARRDKVFGEGTFKLFPHKKFKPLDEGKESIKNSQVIVLSIGGNNFREFLREVLPNIKNLESEEEIKNQFQDMMEWLEMGYLKIIEIIRKNNPNAKIVLVTQYYPSITQNNYSLYPFLQELGRILWQELGFSHIAPNALDVIHQIMMRTYQSIFNAMKQKDNNFVIADVTSSLDPFQDENFVHQIEPSGVGGRKMAAMLSHVIKDTNETNKVYRFTAEFFTSKPENQNKNVIKSNIENWEPLHPTNIPKAKDKKKNSVIENWVKTYRNTARMLLTTSGTAAGAGIGFLIGFGIGFLFPPAMLFTIPLGIGIGGGVGFFTSASYSVHDSLTNRSDSDPIVPKPIQKNSMDKNAVYETMQPKPLSQKSFDLPSESKKIEEERDQKIINPDGSDDSEPTQKSSLKY